MEPSISSILFSLLINFREFMSAIDISWKCSVEEKLSSASKAYDVDGDGQINMAEMKRYEKKFKFISNASKIFNSSSWDLLKIKLFRPKNCFQKMDRNKNGTVDKLEFVDTSLKN